MFSGRRVLAIVLAVAAVLAVGGGRGAAAAGIDQGAHGTAAARRIPNPLQTIGIDCLPGASASSFTSRWRDRMGPLLGFDNPKLIPLGGQRTLWLLTDPYVDLSEADDGALDPTDYVHNTLLLQDGSCFSLVQRVTRGAPWEFAPSRSDRDWYWPLGGSIGAGGLLYV